MDRLERGAEQHRGLIVARGPSALAIDALPGDFELRVDQDHRLRAAAPGTHRAMPVQNVTDRKSFLHTPLLGSPKDGR